MRAHTEAAHKAAQAHEALRRLAASRGPIRIKGRFASRAALEANLRAEIEAAEKSFIEIASKGRQLLGSVSAWRRALMEYYER